MIDESGYGLGDFTKAEMDIIEAARAKKFMIKKGEKYLRVTAEDGGEITVFRAIPELDKICKKYDLYPED